MEWITSQIFMGILSSCSGSSEEKMKSLLPRDIVESRLQLVILDT